MQAAAARYQEEGFSQIYVACARTNTQCFINLLEDRFGEVEEPDLEELETEATRGLRDHATTAEEANVAAMEGPIPADSIMRVTVTQLSVTLEFGLQPDMYPETESVHEVSKKDPTKKTTKFYYSCRKCAKSSQNKISMFTHARRCFNIKLVCSGCKKEYESHDGIEKHINEVHGGNL